MSAKTHSKNLINRVVDTLHAKVCKKAYFESEAEAEDFREELKYILATQRAAFNSPVWFNIGAPARCPTGQCLFYLGSRRHHAINP